MLFVPRMRVSKLSVSSFDDEGYGMMVRSGHVLYQSDELVGTTILLGDRMDRFCPERAYSMARSRRVAIKVRR